MEGADRRIEERRSNWTDATARDEEPSVTRSGVVWIIVGRRGPGQERYVVAVYGHAASAESQAARWLRQHPRGSVDVERYTVLNGAEP